MRVSASVRGLVARWDALVQAELLPAQVPAVVAESGSVLRAGAGEAALEAAESRLGVLLPASYRQFLAVSDGAFADPWGPVRAGEEQGRQHSSVPGLGLLAAMDVAWLDQVVPDVVAAALTDFVPGEPLAGDGCPVLDLSPLQQPGRALLVTSEVDGQLCALVRVDDQDPEWQLWTFSREDITGYWSFGAWLRFAVRQPPSPDQVAQLIEWTHAWDPRGDELSQVDDAAAIPVLVAGLDKYPDDSRLELPVILALGKTKSDDAVPILEERFAANPRHPLRHRACDSLARIGSPAARDALARVRAWNELVELGDPRGLDIALDAVAHDEFHATNVLRLNPDPRYVPTLLAAVSRTSHEGALLGLGAALHACGAPEGRQMLQAMANNPQHRWNRQAVALLRSPTPKPRQPRKN